MKFCGQTRNNCTQRWPEEEEEEEEEEKEEGEYRLMKFNKAKRTEQNLFGLVGRGVNHP